MLIGTDVYHLIKDRRRGKLRSSFHRGILVAVVQLTQICCIIGM
jgi:hypothetical protein